MDLDSLLDYKVSKDLQRKADDEAEYEQIKETSCLYKSD